MAAMDRKGGKNFVYILGLSNLTLCLLEKTSKIQKNKKMLKQIVFVISHLSI